MKPRSSTLLKVVLGMGLTVSTVKADFVVVPGEFALGEANSSDNAPLGANEQHFQQVFGASMLTGVNPGDWITAIGFRVQGGESALPAQTISTYNIGMSQSPSGPGSLSTTFALNRGPDFQLVRSGSLTIGAGDFPGGGTPNGFGLISFSTPYQYLGGHLLVEVEYQGFALGRNADAAYTYSGSLAQTAFGTGFGSTTATLGVFNEALVMGFVTVPFVPEPSSGLLLAAGLALMVTARAGMPRGLP
jgi:hypothetical protein